MSLDTELSQVGDNKFIIPMLSKLHYTNVSFTNKALCFVVNKAYIETDTLSSILIIIEEMLKSIWLQPVGDIEKILLYDGSVRYRQRIFFYSLKEMLNLCRRYSLQVSVSDDFHIMIENITSCVKDISYLKFYASQHGESIDEWLKNCFIVHISGLLDYLGMYNSLKDYRDSITAGKLGYMDRAPFLLSYYNENLRQSSLFLDNTDVNDYSIYTEGIARSNKDLRYGFTIRNISRDRKAGIFK